MGPVVVGVRYIWISRDAWSWAWIWCNAGCAEFSLELGDLGEGRDEFKIGLGESNCLGGDGEGKCRHGFSVGKCGVREVVDGGDGLDDGFRVV